MRALVVVDVQQGFRDRDHWGPRNNPQAEQNIAALVEAWRANDAPIVLVRHDSTEPTSPLRPGTLGNEFEPFIDGAHSVIVAKTVNSAFYGEPDLHAWLEQAGIDRLVICGITTNHCCETTARMAANLGYDVTFAIDATFTHDRTGPDGETISADRIAQMTATNLHDEFATIRTTAALLET